MKRHGQRCPPFDIIELPRESGSAARNENYFALGLIGSRFARGLAGDKLPKKAADNVGARRPGERAACQSDCQARWQIALFFTVRPQVRRRLLVIPASARASARRYRDVSRKTERNTSAA